MKEVNFDSMTNKELLAHAKENGIEIPKKAKKAEIIKLLEEGMKMSEKENENVVTEGTPVEGANVEGSVEGAQENIPTNVNGEATGDTASTEDAKEDKKTYKLDDDSEGSRSAYIRQEFKKDKSRAEIAKELGVKYYVVYSATANMFNAKHPEGGSENNSGSVNVAKVNADFKFVDAEGNTTKKVDVDGVETEVELTAEDAATIGRAELMRELFEAGKTRSELKDYFNVAYATVYAATKDTKAPAGTVRERNTKVQITLEDGTKIDRADYIRQLYADGKGMSRKDIAKKLTKETGDLVDYSIVWSATKPKKADDKKEDKKTEPATPEDAPATPVDENETPVVEDPTDAQ